MSPTARVYRTDIPATPQELLHWHASGGAFERLTPPWRRVEVIQALGTIEPGDSKRLRVPIAGPIGFSWEVSHVASESQPGFTDVQERGPFRSWRHDHRFLPGRHGGSVLEDCLTYELPLGAAGRAIAGDRVERELDRLFALRHERTRNDVVRLSNAGLERPLRVAITGASGLVGKRLAAFLRGGGHEVLKLVRREPAGVDEVFWDPASGRIDAEKLEGLDAVVHMAGASIAGGLWTRKRKAAIRDSRVNGTHLLARTLAGLSHRPPVLVSTSAVGYYGSRADTWLTEESTPGEGFLSGVVQEWESAAAPAAAAGIRVVHPRFGVVLAGEGGMLPLISLPFRLGVGGPLGNGRQYFAWIGLDDLVGVLFESIVNEAFEGPVNAVAPGMVTNEEFSRTLARVLHRPSFFRVPAPLMKLAAGQMAEEVVLVSQRVKPAKLEASGFQFAYPALEQALRHELGKYGQGQAATSLYIVTDDRRVA